MSASAHPPAGGKMWNRTDASISSKRKALSPFSALSQGSRFRDREAAHPKSHSRKRPRWGRGPGLLTPKLEFLTQPCFPKSPKSSGGGQSCCPSTSTAWRVSSGHSLGSLAAPARLLPRPPTKTGSQVGGASACTQGHQP